MYRVNTKLKITTLLFTTVFAGHGWTEFTNEREGAAQEKGEERGGSGMASGGLVEMCAGQWRRQIWF